MRHACYKLLKKHGKTLSFVESCTGGGLCKDFVLISGASDILRGSLVAYQDFTKENMLGIDAELIKQFTTVSAECAAEMSKKGADFFRSDFCLSTTGWAGPGGGTDADPVGTVYFAACGQGAESLERRTFSECNDRGSVMDSAVSHAWKVLHDFLTNALEKKDV
jgi:PncC family amidohydrolase